MTKIAILCPTRGRPEQCRRMIESVSKTAMTDRVNIYLSLHDEEVEKYSIELNKCQIDPNRVDIACLVHPEYPTVHKWNELAKFSYRTPFDHTHFMLGADDMVFATPGWDTALIEHYAALKEKVHVYALQDSRDANGTPHPIVTREYIEALGYAFPPIFLHWWIDSWTVDIGKSCGVFTHLKDYLLTHIKPSDAGVGDETHNRIRRNGWHERDTYVNDTCQHFLEAEKIRLDNYLRANELKKPPNHIDENGMKCWKFSERGTV